MKENEPENIVTSVSVEKNVERYTGAAIKKRIESLPSLEKNILDQELNKLGLGLDLNFEFSSASEETLKRFASLLGDLKFHQDNKSKQGIAKEIASLMENL